MRLSITFSTYLGRQFLAWFFSIFLLFAGLILLFDVIELLRRTSARPDATLATLIQMSLFQLPHLAQKSVPFAILFGGMLVFWRLNRAHELVVARAAGVSVWQFLMPILALAFLIGAFEIMVFNPFAAIMLSRFEQLEAKHIRGKSSLMDVSSRGVWLRQTSEAGHSIIHASRISPQTMRLDKVIIFEFQGKDRFIGRIDALTARLENGAWHLTDAWLSGPTGVPRFKASHAVPTDLTPEAIHDSFASPESMTFWELPGFIGVLERAGFSGVRHRLYWHSLVASPFLLAAMVLIAAAFSLRPTRRSGGGAVIVGGIGVGFLLYFLSDVVYALGLSASVPVLLAAWTPAGVSLMLGLATIFHLEDG